MTNEELKCVVKPWQMVEGKVTQIKIDKDVYVVNPTADVDPIEAASELVRANEELNRAKKAFSEAFNIPKTNVVRKATTTTVPIKQDETPDIRTIGEMVGKENNLPIYKNTITGFYRIKPDEFTTESMKDYFRDIYINNLPEGAPSPKENSVLNKQRATLKFLRNNGYVRLIEGHGNYKQKYKWLRAPFGAIPAAQAEVSSEYFRDMQRRELMSFRQQ
jgi:hypothetical protein